MIFADDARLSVALAIGVVENSRTEKEMMEAFNEHERLSALLKTWPMELE